MALSGTIVGSKQNYFGVEIDWTGAQNVSGNYTTITAKVYITYYSINIQSRTTAQGCSCTINGVAQGYSTTAINHNPASSYRRLVATKTQVVYHNSDGTKSCTISASFPFNLTANSGYIGTMSASQTVTLNTIGRATTPTVSGAKSLGSSITISTSGRASTDFTHKLYYSWGSQYTNVKIADGVTTGQSWTIPKTLAEVVQGATSGTMYIKCETYKGSSLIGTKTISLDVEIPNTAEFKPTASITGVTAANTLAVNAFVAGKTRLRIAVNTVGGYVSGSANRNSYPTTAKITVDGKTYLKTLGREAAASWIFDTDLIQSAGTKTITVEVADSRGRTNTETSSVTVYEYAAPIISAFTANRCLQDGTLSDSGTYILCSLTASVSSLNSLNAKTYKIVYDNNGTEIMLAQGTLSSYSAATVKYNSYTSSKTFSTDSAWTVRAYVYDSLNTNSPAVAAVIVPTEKTFMDWRQNGNGLAFGKVSERDGLEIAWPVYFDGGIYAAEVSGGTKKYNQISDFVIEQGSSANYAYRKWKSGRAECWAKVNISAEPCNTAVGSWFRTQVLSMPSYPFNFAEVPTVNMFFSTAVGTGGLVWTAGAANDSSPLSKPENCYIIRMSSAASISGTINIAVFGRWK